MRKLITFYVIFIFLFTISFSGYSYGQINPLDTVKAGKFDNGKMWTFEHPPINYFKEAYNFAPDKSWFDHVRSSALRFANYCSASFVSEDGLIMTNHHCGRDAVSSVQLEGEDLHANGFYAETIDKERKVKDLYVDQLVQIIDVTKEVLESFESEKDDELKIELRKKKIDELEKTYSEKLGLICKVIPLYNGAEYSLYAYKRYTDVRLVFAPEDQIGFFGGDPDNFTYPRYNLDMTFFRAYDEDGKPIKCENYFKWNVEGAQPGEPIFVVGNPGRTDRLKTVAQLEYDRDITYPLGLQRLNKIIDSLKLRIELQPELRKELNNQIFYMENGRKVYSGILKGLNDPILMAKRKDFEKKFKDAVNNNQELKSKYSKIWDEISELLVEKKNVYIELMNTDTTTSDGLEMANKLRNRLKSINAKENVKMQNLGKALFEVYGTTIPPDATFTLRISDGVIKGYEYNGTIAPPKTTFHGIYDRYFSFNKEYPWSLPERWKNPPPEFDLSVPINFVSTNDIIGGNSGSPVINVKAEIIGLAFDGNIESLPGRFIYTTEANRTISVDSKGILEAIKNLYKAERLYNELISGKLK